MMLDELSMGVIFLLIVLGIAWLVLFIWTIVDVLTSKMRGREKFAWVMAILGFNFIMPVAWLFFRRKARRGG